MLEPFQIPRIQSLEIDSYRERLNLDFICNNILRCIIVRSKKTFPRWGVDPIVFGRNCLWLIEENAVNKKNINGKNAEKN